MTKPIDKVRQILETAEDVDLPDSVVMPSGSFGEDPGPQDDGRDGYGDADFAPDSADDRRGLPPPPEGEDDRPPEARCALYPLNDFGNGQRLVEHFGENILFVPRVGYHLWTGTRFMVDPDDIQVRRLAHKLTELIEAEVDWMPQRDSEAQILTQAEATAEELDQLGVVPAKDRTDDQLQRMLALQRIATQARDIRDQRSKSVARRLTHAKNAGNSNAIKNLLTEAATILARPLSDLDADPMQINTESGLLRFDILPGEDDGGMNRPPPRVEVQCLPHAREQLLTKMVAAPYDPKATCPLFTEFLTRIQPLPEMRRFLQRWFGYSMTGLTAEQKFAFFYGFGANGKSVLVDLMAKIMGDYAASAKIESITGQNRRGGGDATPDLMPLIGARFVRTSEPDEGQMLQEGLIKELTGGEPILVRALNQNFVLVYPIFKLTISGNHRPEIRGGDDGIWRRVMLVPFHVQIPLDERDPELGAKLWEERAGILNWMVGGLRDYLAHGLRVPDAVTAATQEYREDSDPMATFLTLCCQVTGDPTDTLTARDLGHAFAYWMADTGKGAWKPRTIDNKLSAKAGRWKSPETGQVFNKRKSSTISYDGIRLVNPFRDRFLNAPRLQDGTPIIVGGR